jgi:hypothetical protein
LVGIPIGRQQQVVYEVLNSQGEHEYSITLPRGSLDEDAPIIAGDLLFNVRSGLNHLLAATIAAEDRGDSQFPIFIDDPDELDPMTQKPLRPWVRGAWLKQTGLLHDPVTGWVRPPGLPAGS